MSGKSLPPNCAPCQDSGYLEDGEPCHCRAGKIANIADMFTNMHHDEDRVLALATLLFGMTERINTLEEWVAARLA